MSDRSSHPETASYGVVGSGRHRRISVVPSGSILQSTQKGGRGTLLSIPSDQSLDAQDKKSEAEGDAVWTCTACTYVNEDTDSGSCLLCNTVRDGARDTSVDKDTSAEDAKNNRPKSRQSMMNMSFGAWGSFRNSDAWECASCTYVNLNSRHLSCEVCGVTRGNSPPPMEEFGNMSLRSGQATFVQVQSDEVVRVGERAMEKERMSELLAAQKELMDQYDSKQGKERAMSAPKPTDEVPLHAGKTSKSRVSASALGALRRNIEDKQRSLDECRRQLEALEKIQQEEKEEQEAMGQVQEQTRLELERESNLSNADGCSGQDSTFSQRQNEWKAQQRMLDEWKDQWVAREKQLKHVRLQQQKIIDAGEKKLLDEDDEEKLDEDDENQIAAAARAMS